MQGPKSLFVGVANRTRSNCKAAVRLMQAPTILKKEQGSQKGLFGFLNNIERLLNNIRLGTGTSSGSVAPAA